MMQKITLKPVVTELLYKTDEVNTHGDVLAYSGAGAQEKTLGSLYLIGQAKYDEQEDLGYVISLVSSLAKREYYSEASLRGQDSKRAFEGTLKKLNEVLLDFFKNKSLALNIGLAAIAGDQLYISKLGKFKVGLARNGEHIDVLNNIALFQKSPENEQQFSNIISGKLQPGDKLFAYCPTRPISLRERMLQATLVKEPQGQFAEKISQLASSVDAFSCCGIHVAMEEIKEIPLETPTTTLATAQTFQSGPRPHGVGAELSVSKKSTVIDALRGTTALFKRPRGFVVIAIVVLVPLLTIVGFRSAGDSGELKAAYRHGLENLKTIQEKIAQNDNSSARALILETLENIQPLEGEKILALEKELETSLDSLDHVSQVLPVFVAALSEEPSGIVLAFEDNKPSVLYNGAELLKVKEKEYTLKDPVTATDATLYEGNLYTLAGGQIYKYADALNGGTARSNWGKPEAALQSIAVDGNLYGLSADGKVTTYFKGEKKSEFDSGLPVSEQNKIVTSSDETVIYLANPETKRLYALDKTTGALTTTYKLDSIGELKTITMSDDGVWLLSQDNKVWKLIVIQP